MRTGSTGLRSSRRSVHNRLTNRNKNGRKAHLRWLDVDALEPRTLLATIPAATQSGVLQNLSGLGNVTLNGNANSPTVEIDPYNPDVLFAVWQVDEGSQPVVPGTTTVVEGAYSTDAGAYWNSLGAGVSFPQLDPLTINAAPPTLYTQVTSPSVAFDAQDNVYVLTEQETSATDGLLYLTEFNFSGGTYNGQVGLSNNGYIYQWITGSDGATDPTLAVDQAPPSGTAEPDPHANNVYIAWASTDVEPADPRTYLGTEFDPNQAYLVVGTPTSESNGQESISFSGIQDVSVTSVPASPSTPLAPAFDGSFGPQLDSHPQLVINQNDGGHVTVGWDDFGTGATATPPYDNLDSNLVTPGDAFGFDGDAGPISPATTMTLDGATVTVPQTTPFTDDVTIPGSELSSIDDLTVTVDVTDQQTVSNLSLVLVAPNGDSITLVENQINAAGKAIPSQGLPGGNSIGVYGFTTGATGDAGINVGTTFDDNGVRDIFDPTTAGINGNSAVDYVGTFRPEGSPGGLTSLTQLIADLGSGNLNNDWTLDVTNYSPAITMGVSPQAALTGFSLHFSTGLTFATGAPSHSPATITSTYVRGALNNTFPRTVPSTPNGVGPGLVLAIDNTFGPVSSLGGVSYGPNAYNPEGRIYAAYVAYVDNGFNPAVDTEIALSYSDNGGQSWTFAGFVNQSTTGDDNSIGDGYSSGNPDEPEGYTPFTSGRTVFQPEIAVDQATGTVVVSWRDAGNDAANARVATYIAYSFDGGNTFSPQSYANPNQTAIDAITGATDIIGPAADNESAGNPNIDIVNGYGDQMGLAVFDGQVYPIWAGNLNLSSDATGTVVADPLNIYYMPMNIAAGPRIVNSTMGPTTYAQATSGSIPITINFDRPVIASTFVSADVLVYYHSAVAGSGYVGPLPIVPNSLTPEGTEYPGDAYETFTIDFNPLPSGATTPYDYTGTYSYLITPDNGLSGAQKIIISSPIEAYYGTTLQTEDRDDQNASGASDQNPITTPYYGSAPGDVYADPAPELPAYTSITWSSALQILGEPSNANTLPIIVPGPQVLSATVPGGEAGSGNLVTNGTVSQTTVTFDRGMQVSTFAGETDSFTPNNSNQPVASEVDQIMGPAGSVSGPQSFPANEANSTITIPAASSATQPGIAVSQITIPSYDGTFTIADLTVALTAEFATDSDLSAYLLPPPNQLVPTPLPADAITLFSGVGGTGANFINTVFDDSAEN